MSRFWQNLKKPFFVLAPMEQVTDTVFRQIVASCKAPDVFFTEFTSAGGIAHAAKRVEEKIDFTPIETPLIIQLWGNDPEQFYEAAKYVAEKGFAGIDLNTGCPDKSVVGHGAGSGLIKTPALVGEIIDAIKKGAPEMPISIKTRLGFERIITEEWISYLLSLDIDALTIHGRTRKEMSKVPAHWDEIGKAVKIRNEMKKDIVIIGNGDVTTREDGIQKAEKYGLDGIMVGRGIFSNVWFFEENPSLRQKTIEENIAKLIEHTDLFEEKWGKGRDFNILKKFYKVYVKDFPCASLLRQKLMEAENSDEVRNIINDFIKNGYKDTQIFSGVFAGNVSSSPAELK